MGGPTQAPPSKAAQSPAAAPTVETGNPLADMSANVGRTGFVADFKIEPNKGLNAVDTAQLIRSGINPDTFTVEPAQKTKPD